jgi:hypothetical protein
MSHVNLIIYKEDLLEKSNEQKPQPRIPLSMEIKFKKNYGRNTIPGILKNISLSGAFLKVDNISKVSHNEKISLVLEVAGRKRAITAYIIWQNSEGCGVSFRHSNNRDLQLVDDLMYFVENDRSERREFFADFLKIAS